MITEILTCVTDGSSGLLCDVSNLVYLFIYSVGVIVFALFLIAIISVFK